MRTADTQIVQVQLPVFAWMGVLATLDDALRQVDRSELGVKVLAKCRAEVAASIQDAIPLDAYNAIMAEILSFAPPEAL